MFSRYTLLSLLLAMLSSCGGEPGISSEQQFINDAAAALGGDAEIAAASTLTMEAEGRMLNVGQDLAPESATMEFTISDYRLTADLGQLRSRTVLTRTPQFDYFRGRDPMRITTGIDGDVAYDVNSDGSARRVHDDIAAVRGSSYYHHPLPLLRAALLGAAAVSNVRTENGHTLADITIESGKAFTLAIDSSTKLPVYIRSTDHHPYLQDVVRTTEFSDYATFDGLTLPTIISRSLDEFEVFHLQVTAQSLGAATDDTAAPAEPRSTPPITGTPPAQVTAEQLDDGVWLLAGQSHHSVLFEFDDHLKLMEAPNESRTLAVIAKAQELVPEKPVTHMINTHHHFDHSGGLRAAVAAGLTIVTQAANEAFYRRMAEQPSTIKPDALARTPRAINIEIVEEQRTYADESMTLELYHVAGSEHSSSILMAYLPKQRLVMEADLYTPGRTTPQLFAPNLLSNIQQHGLEVDRIVPIHGNIVDFAELETAVQALGN